MWEILNATNNNNIMRCSSKSKRGWGSDTKEIIIVKRIGHCELYGEIENMNVVL